ncbi:MAG: hypothetical protein RLY84_400 [Actinomycetota bacterium]|jgi:ADP-ribosylglycohydrolase
MNFQNKVHGCLAGAAVGDALGGATERFSAEEIVDRYQGFVEGIVPPYHIDFAEARPIAPFHKGDGHITDDSLMTEALVGVYSRVRRHLDAHSFAKHIIPELVEFPRYIPEMEKDSLLIHRLYFAEKWLYQRLYLGGVDPREAGVGNMVNCGAAMYISPVGIVNAGDPAGAYYEAIDITGAHQSSYGREAAAVLSACVASAFEAEANYETICETALKLAKDGTREAIESVLNVASKLDTWRGNLNKLRDAIRPFDSMGENFREMSPDARRPSRVQAIEELPIALGMVYLTKGDFREAVLGGVNYGRDSDSIASMAGAIIGALQGITCIPDEWISNVETASKRKYSDLAATMGQVAIEIMQSDHHEYENLRRLRADLLASRI